MPPMPEGDPWPSIKTVLKAESDVRGGKSLDAGELGIDSYWADLVRILQIHLAEKGDTRTDDIADRIEFKKFRHYIASRLRKREGK